MYGTRGTKPVVVPSLNLIFIGPVVGVITDEGKGDRILVVCNCPWNPIITASLFTVMHNVSYSRCILVDIVQGLRK